MSEFSHLKNKLLAEQVEDEIYHYILDTPLEPRRGIGEVRQTRAAVLYQDREIA